MKKLLQSAMLISMPYGIIGFFIPLQSAELGASPVQTGLLFSVFTLLAITLRPWVGKLSDRVGRKPIFISALALFCLVQVLYLSSSGYLGLLLARVVQGLAASLLSVSLFATVADLAEPGKGSTVMGQATGKLRIADMAGFIIGFYMLGNGDSFKSMYAVFLVISLVALILAATGFPQTQPQPKVGEGKAQGQASNPFRVLLFGIGLAGALLAPVTILFVRDYIIADVASVAMVFLPGALIGAMLPAHTGKLADKFGPGMLVPAGLVVVGICVFFFPLASTPGAFALVYGISALGGTLSGPALKAMAANQGLGFGASYGEFFFISGLAGVFGAVLGGWLYQQYPLWVVFACSGILTIAMALYKLIRVPTQQEGSINDHGPLDLRIQ